MTRDWHESPHHEAAETERERKKDERAQKRMDKRNETEGQPTPEATPTRVPAAWGYVSLNDITDHGVVFNPLAARLYATKGYVITPLFTDPTVTDNGLGTPGARWRDLQQQDPHGIRYDCERSALLMGHLTDDELANAQYLEDRSSLRLHSYQDAAKDRIRWLSRALAKALGEVGK